MRSLRFLIKAQINKDKYVSQKTTLCRPNSLTKAMDGLFKFIGNRAWFTRALSYWGHLETACFEAHAEEKNSMSCVITASAPTNVRLKLNSVLYGFANSRIMLCIAAKNGIFTT